jgi:hypothetical protein
MPWPGWLFVPVLFVGFVLFVFVPTDAFLRLVWPGAL